MSNFSSRLPWDTHPNALSEVLRAKASADVLDATESNPTRAGFHYPADQILAALANSQALEYRPAPLGILEARELIAASYGVSADRVILTSSTSEAYSWVFKLLADPGDEILTPRPSYPLFDFLAGLEGLRAVHYPLTYDDGWSIDFERLADAATARTRAIVVVNPNNPTGSYLKKDELERLEAFARNRDLAIISDEVFSPYALTEDTARVDSLVDSKNRLTFCFNGLSKLVGLPQMKLGWIVVCGEHAARSAALDRLELIADTYLSVGTPVQLALPQLLSMRECIAKQILARLKGNFAYLRTAVQGSAFSSLAVEGGWYATLRAPRVRTEEQWALDLLRDENVLVQPGYFYDFESEAFLVLSLLTPERVFREAVNRIVHARGPSSAP